MVYLYQEVIDMTTANSMYKESMNVAVDNFKANLAKYNARYVHSNDVIISKGKTLYTVNRSKVGKK